VCLVAKFMRSFLYCDVVKSFLFSVLFPICAIGQTAPFIVAAGYSFPTPLYVAPGQIITLYVAIEPSTTTDTLRSPAGPSLATTLGGLSFVYGQTLNYQTPILEIQPYNSCGAECFGAPANPWYNFIAVTIQIPYEAQSTLPPLPSSQGAIPTGGITMVPTSTYSSQPMGFVVLPLTDQVHILDGCEPFMTSTLIGAPYPTGLPCPPLVVHANGTPVSASNPADAGEELVAYAVGLGQTSPASVTGQLVTKSVPTITTYLLDFNFHPNALASRPLPNAPTANYAGTTPGFVGLYQVNFTVPPVPAGMPPCVDASNLPLGSNVVQSNLTVSIGGQYSFDGARICVAIQ